MKILKLLIIAIGFLYAQVIVAQKLKHFSFEQDDNNPHKFLLQPRVDRVVKAGDSLSFEITWLDNCDIEPKIRLDKVSGDTLHFSYSDSEEGNSFSPCAYNVKLLVTRAKLPDYKVVFRTVKLDGKKRRYRADAYIVEYYPGMSDERKILREIYIEGKNLLAEVFYDNEGRIISEKYYNRSWGYLIRERKY
jgi:hypothetical protein